MASVEHLKLMWTKKAKQLAWSLAVSPKVPVVLAGYAVIGLFALVYVIVRSSWPEQTQAASLIIAALAAAPLALALLWDRLGGVKVLGLELTLIPSSIRIEPEVVKVVAEITEHQSLDIDSLTALAEKITQAIARPEQELLELNLRDGNYWWSTRLFLAAALAEDYSQIRRLVFVELGDERIFVGMASPGDVRRALANEWPTLELSYQKIRNNPPSVPSPSASEPSKIVVGWDMHQFELNNECMREDDLKLRVKVDTASLNSWLGKMGMRLTTESAEWQGITRPYLVQYILTEFDSPYVALLRHRRLDRVVNRHDLALKVAMRALGRPDSSLRSETP